MVLLGIGVGVVITAVIWTVGFNIKSPSMAVAQWYYGTATFAAIAAIVFLFVPRAIRKLDPNLRVCMLFAASLILGGMLPCDLLFAGR
jgi:hypothetical protein